MKEVLTNLQANFPTTLNREHENLTHFILENPWHTLQHEQYQV